MHVSVVYNTYMGHRRDVTIELKTKYDPIIRARENGRCYLCNAPGRDVHEILSRGRFSTYELDVCISPRNMVLLCRKHHEMCQGVNDWMARLFRALKWEHGYDYHGSPFQWYYEQETYG